MDPNSEGNDPLLMIKDLALVNWNLFIRQITFSIAKEFLCPIFALILNLGQNKSSEGVFFKTIEVTKMSL